MMPISALRNFERSLARASAIRPSFFQRALGVEVVMRRAEGSSTCF